MCRVTLRFKGLMLIIDLEKGLNEILVIVEFN